jgi:hypothetical protein
MAYRWYTWLADEFRAAGLEVIEVTGWKTRGRPASSGANDARGLNVHHTAASSSFSNPAPGVALLITGREDLPGPIAHYAVDYLGRVWVVAAGRANVNGANRGVPNIPAGDGNAQLIGNEVITNGTQALSTKQLEAIYLTSAVVLRKLGRDVDGYLYRHADTSKTGKWDIGQLTTAQLRDGTKAALKRLQTGTPTEEDDMAYSRQQLKEIFAETMRENIGDVAANDEKSWWSQGIRKLVREEVAKELDARADKAADA